MRLRFLPLFCKLGRLNCSVRVFPRGVALGETGDHYLKGWDEDDENRVKPAEQKKPEKGIPGEDYLNNWEDLLDE